MIRILLLCAAEDYNMPPEMKQGLYPDFFRYNLTVCSRSSMDRVMDFESSGSEFDPRREHNITGDQLLGLPLFLNKVNKYCMSRPDYSPYALLHVHMKEIGSFTYELAKNCSAD
jgi:hypothetical protein